MFISIMGWWWRSKNHDTSSSDKKEEVDDAKSTSSSSGTDLFELPREPLSLFRRYVKLSDESEGWLRRGETLVRDDRQVQIMLGAAAALSFGVGFRLGRVRPAWRRHTDVASVPDVGPASPYLRGRIVSVSDGDTMRFVHAPMPWQSGRLGDGERVSDVALPVRICSIDTPETAKFGKPGQPYGDVAKEYLSSMVEDRIVGVKILSKDQYGRAVCQVRKRRSLLSFVPVPGWYLQVDEAMLKAGLAEVYTGGGAVYGPKSQDYYLKLQAKAQRAGKGMWAEKDRESAAEYKARMKQE